MPRQQRIKSENGYYHIMIRGNERRDIFLDDEDRLRFIDTIYEKKLGNRFYLHAFCLMDNHVHLMLSEGTEDIAKVMKRITVSYVFYFNKKYKRIGHLFQDRFRSEIVENDRYVLSLARYIHQNPLKAGAVKGIHEYRWSSYNSYLDTNTYFNKVLDKELILGLFSDEKTKAEKHFKEYMNEYADGLFIDIPEAGRIMDEEEARALYENMLLEYEVDGKEPSKEHLPDSLIREFRKRTNLSIRKIAEIIGLNKDKVNKILNS